MRRNDLSFHPCIQGVVVAQNPLRRGDALLDYLIEGPVPEKISAQPDALAQSSQIERIGQQVEVELGRPSWVA